MSQVQVIIEMSAGSRLKLEMENDRLEFNRLLPTNMAVPENYGYIEGVMSPDGDQADVFVFSEQPLPQGITLTVTVIGVIKAEDEKGLDPKYLAVPLAKTLDSCSSWQEAINIPQNRLEKVKYYVEHHKDQEPEKWVKILGMGNRAQAQELLAGKQHD